MLCHSEPNELMKQHPVTDRFYAAASRPENAGKIQDEETPVDSGDGNTVRVRPAVCLFLGGGKQAKPDPYGLYVRKQS